MVIKYSWHATHTLSLPVLQNNAFSICSKICYKTTLSTIHDFKSVTNNDRNIPFLEFVSNKTECNKQNRNKMANKINKNEACKPMNVRHIPELTITHLSLNKK